jgi:hypothetical protein
MLEPGLPDVALLTCQTKGLLAQRAPTIKRIRPRGSLAPGQPGLGDPLSLTGLR